jgi:hypothetical protein
VRPEVSSADAAAKRQVATPIIAASPAVGAVRLSWRNERAFRGRRAHAPEAINARGSE